MTPYEEPTNDLRQVRHERRLSSGDVIHWYSVERKWYVDLPEQFTAPHNMFEQDDRRFLWFDGTHERSVYQRRRVEWRALPMAFAEDVK